MDHNNHSNMLASKRTLSHVAQNFDDFTWIHVFASRGAMD